MRRMMADDDGLLPLLIGVGLAVTAFFGIGYVVGSWTDITAFLRDGLVGTFLFIVGIFALMGKFTLLGRGWAVFMGLVCLGSGIAIAMGMV